MEIALRALKNVHLTHTPWKMKKRELGVDELRELNEGIGIFLALETTVASAISNEFIYSSFTSGMHIKSEGADEAESRYFEILREVTFKTTDESKLFLNDDLDVTQSENNVDLVTRRWKNAEVEFPPSLIELKRYNKYNFKIQSGKASKAGTNCDGIIRDILNLKVIRTNINNISLDKSTELKINNFGDDRNVYLYVLTWGIFEAEGEISDVRDFLFNELKHGGVDLIAKKDVRLKWLPLKFVDDNTGAPPQIKEWLWLALIEIDPPA